MSDDCDFKLPLLKECQPLDLPTIVPENYELEFPLLKPPCIPSFSGSATVTVRPVKLNESNQPINKDIKLVSDSNSECSYKMSGNIDICVPNADAYVDAGYIKWFNEGGTKTTINEVAQNPATSGTYAYVSTTAYVIKFWNCSDSTGANRPDRTQIIPASGSVSGGSGSGGPTPITCVDTSWATLDVTSLAAPKLKWFNSNGNKTTVTETIDNTASGQTANTVETVLSGISLTDLAGTLVTYDPSRDYKVSFWCCNVWTETSTPLPDKVVHFPALHGTKAVPYAMGTNEQGSKLDNGNGTWGSSTDGSAIYAAHPEKLRTDEWERGKPPIPYGSVTSQTTDGVTNLTPRIYKRPDVSPAYIATLCDLDCSLQIRAHYIFTRNLFFDSKGLLYKVGPETRQELISLNDFDSPSGWGDYL